MLELASNWRPLETDQSANPVDERYVAGFGRPGDLGVIAEDPADRAAGAAWCRLRTLALAVSAEHRGHGLGTMLLDALNRAAADSGFSALSLSVEPDNPSRRIYERAGFTRCGEYGGSWTMLVKLPSA